MRSFNCLNIYKQLKVSYPTDYQCVYVYILHISVFKHGEYSALSQIRDSISGLAVSRLGSHSDFVPTGLHTIASNT